MVAEKANPQYLVIIHTALMYQQRSEHFRGRVLGSVSTSKVKP